MEKDQIIRYLTNQANSEESAAVEKWIAESDDNLNLISDIYNAIAMIRSEEGGFSKQQLHRKYKITARKAGIRIGSDYKLLKIGSIAAAIAIVLGTLIFSLKDIEPQNIDTKTKAPGRGAILELADGSSIKLDKTNREIRTESGEIIRIDDNTVRVSGNCNKMNNLVVPRGGEYTVILSDSTRVYVNSDSKLSYPASFDGKTREVTLVGEAFFEVAENRDKPFIVNINGTKLRVTGTSFNVSCYADEKIQTITLQSGGLEVRSGKGTYMLTPNRQAIVNMESGEVSVRRVTATDYSAWKSGEFMFDQVDFEQIMRTISRWYDIEYSFDDPSLKTIRFSGAIHRYGNIEDAIRIINLTDKVVCHFESGKLHIVGH